MSKAAAWMPLYVGDYLGDTQRLSTEQHGAYLLLILDYWRSGPAPDDDAVLQQITRLDAKAWKRHRSILARLFQVSEGEWRHKRIDRELADAASNADRRSDKARAAAEARWGASTKDAASNARSMPDAMLGECPPPSPSPQKKSSDADASDVAASASPPNPPKPIDLKAAVFASGVPLLTSTGTPERSARSMLGRWRQEHGDGSVLDCLAAAQAESPSDPIPWITRALGARNGQRSHHNGTAKRSFRDPLLQADFEAGRFDPGLVGGP